MVEDIHPGQGPLAGIHAALAASSAELNLMVAVDMPFLTHEFLEFLLAEARTSDALVTVPRLHDGWQPLCAVYRRGFLPYATTALAEGRNRIDVLYAQLPVHVLDSAQLAANGFTPSIFHNLNTPADLEEARRKFVDGSEK